MWMLRVLDDELKIAPTCGEVDDIDVDANMFSDGGCCDVNESDCLFRSED